MSVFTAVYTHQDWSWQPYDKSLYQQPFISKPLLLTSPCKHTHTHTHTHTPARAHRHTHTHTHTRTPAHPRAHTHTDQSKPKKEREREGEKRGLGRERATGRGKGRGSLEGHRGGRVRVREGREGKRRREDREGE